MNDDELLTAAHQAIKEEDSLANPRWDALARGELPKEQSESLRQDPSAYAAFAPMDTAAMERLVVESLPGQTKVLPFRRWRSVATTVTVLAAAAMAFVLFRPKEGHILPPYEMTVAGEKLERGDTPTSNMPVRVGPGSRIEIVLRPSVPYRSPISARIFLVRAGRVQRLDVPVQSSSEGALRIAGSFDDLFRGIDVGTAEIVAAIGPEEDLPAENEVLQIAPDQNDVQVIRTPVSIVAR